MKHAVELYDPETPVDELAPLALLHTTAPAWWSMVDVFTTIALFFTTALASRHTLHLAALVFLALEFGWALSYPRRIMRAIVLTAIINDAERPANHLVWMRRAAIALATMLTAIPLALSYLFGGTALIVVMGLWALHRLHRVFRAARNRRQAQRVIRLRSSIYWTELSERVDREAAAALTYARA